MITHGFCADKREAALAGITAGVDMEMLGESYRLWAAKLVKEGLLPIEWIDDAVRRILGIKFALGLFDNPYTNDRDSSCVFSVRISI